MTVEHAVNASMLVAQDGSDLSWACSSYGNPEKANVEVAFPGCGWAWVRNSENPEGPALRFSEQEWLAFTDGVADGELRGPVG